MVKNTYKGIVVKELVTKIRQNMSSFIDPFVYERIFIDDEYHRREFNKVKETCILINELLSCIDIKNHILDMSISTTTDKFNKQNVDAKYDTFKMLRNLLIHFPIFESWNDVYINEKLLLWNNPRNSYVLNYFKKYSGKRLVYNIYTKNSKEDDWYIGCTINILIPKTIPKNKKLYLKDFISFLDVIRIFSIVDYYLDYLGFDLIQYQYLSV